MGHKPQIAIVGPGRLGTALALALREAGYRVSELIVRKQRDSKSHARRLASQLRTRLVKPAEAKLEANLVWLCVPDSAIGACANSLAPLGRWEGKIIFHSSGALLAAKLSSLRKRGAAVASVHPLMTFVRNTRPNLRGVPFAIEGDPAAIRAARKIVRDLGGEPFPLKQRDKILYHAWGAFASPLMITLLAEAENVAAAAGVRSAAARKRMLPILRQTLQNYAEHGAAASLSGPLVRGDITTVRQHLRALSQVPRAKEVYAALARSALHTLPVRDRRGLERELAAGMKSTRSRARRKS